MKNKEIARIFSLMALYLEMDDVAFKPRAYAKAAEALELLADDVEGIYKEEGLKGLQSIEGVGKTLAEHMEEYIKTGAIKEYEMYRKKIPVDIEALTAIEGIGAKKVKELYKKLGIKTVRDLEEAGRQGKIQALPGFGKKSEENILQGIAFQKQSGGRRVLDHIYPYAEQIIQMLLASPLVKQAILAGSFRRMRETVGDVDILVLSDKSKEVSKLLLDFVPHVKVWGQGPTKTSLRTVQGFDIDLRVVPEEAYGSALQYFTGSKNHNVKVRTLAAQKGLKVSEYGVFRGKKCIASKTEADVYSALGMQYIEPELREDAGEIEAALTGTLPNVVPYGSLKGDLQTQTNWTDGAHSIEQMAREAKQQGLEYIAITDHTRDLAMTGGLDEKKLLAQMAEIDRINAKPEFQASKFKILKGAEVNIRKDGTLDIEDEVLAKLDVVGISVHSNFKMSRKDMTERIARAMRNPHADILFHPTGRLINKRPAYEVDMDEIVKTAKETGTILEINAFPERADLRDEDIRKAVNAGVKMSIDSDAHAMEHFGVLRFGIAQARRGWAEQKDIINTQKADKMVALLKDKKRI